MTTSQVKTRPRAKERASVRVASDRGRVKERAPRASVAARTYKVQVLERAFGLLDCFTRERPVRGISELSREMTLHKATVHRLLSVLERWGYVRQIPETGRYRLGAKLVELGSRAVDSVGLAHVAKPILERLAAETGETAHLMVLDGTEGLYLEKVESVRPFRMPSQVGRRIPLHCTGVGKALLAHLPEKAVEEIIKVRGLPRFTKNTISTMAGLRREFEDVRRRGYAVDREEAELGLRCVAAPVFDGDGRIVASISIAGPDVRVAEEKTERLGKVVSAAAHEISEELGYGHSKKANE